MTSAELLADAFGRIQGVIHRVVEGLSPDKLSFRIEDEANTIAWLIWHLARIQDDHVADVVGAEQVYTSGGWADRFALPFDVRATGFGHSPDDVAAVRVESGDLLTGYYDAVHEKTLEFVGPLKDDDLDRIVDKRWDPPVTLGVRLVSVISDNIQHAGQAAYVRGIIERS